MTDREQLQRLRAQRLAEMTEDEHRQRLLWQRLSGLGDEEQWDLINLLCDENYTPTQAIRVLLKLPLPEDLDARGRPLPGTSPPEDTDEYFREQRRDLSRDISKAELEELEAIEARQKAVMDAQLDEHWALMQEREALKRGDLDALRPETRERLLNQAEQEWLSWPWWRRWWWRRLRYR